MQAVYGQSAGITVDAGWYVTKFVGDEPRPDMDGSKYGKGMIQRMAWVWEITEGPRKGERIAQETGTVAVPKSGCARVILGLAGGAVQVGKQVDTNVFIGKPYRIKVAVNPDSDKGNLHVADIEPIQPGQGHAQPQQPRPAAPKAPSRPAPGPQAAPEPKFFVGLEPGQDAVTFTGPALQAWFNDHPDADPNTLDVMVDDGKGVWGKAADFGFKHAF